MWTHACILLVLTHCETLIYSQWLDKSTSLILTIFFYFVVLVILILLRYCFESDSTIKSWTFLWSNIIQKRWEKFRFLEIMFLFLFFQKSFFVAEGLRLFTVWNATSGNIFWVLIKLNLFHWSFRRFFIFLFRTLLLWIWRFVPFTLFQKIFIALSVSFDESFRLPDWYEISSEILSFI